MSTGFYCFFSHSSARLPDLHSFPTRRSSDLDMYESLYNAEGSTTTTPDAAALSELKTRGFAGSDKQCAEQIRALQDRKSTRLNSSHSQISYAVFCLKKKTSRTP